MPDEYISDVEAQITVLRAAVDILCRCDTLDRQGSLSSVS